jgi:hypothetical protein
MLVEIAAVVAKEAAPVALESLVRALLTAQDAQLERLKALHEDVEVLVEGPWKRAQIHLGEVGTVKGRHRQEECLLEAQRALYEALSLSQGTAREAVIAADLALVWGLRGERDEASNWAKKSFDAAEGYLIKLADEAQALLRATPELKTSLRSSALSFMPPSVEWLWWKNEVTSEDQLPPLRRAAGSQSYFVPLRLRLRPAIVAGRELPLDEKQIGPALGLPQMSWLHAKTAVWTLRLPAIRRLYDARRAYQQLDEYRQLCAAFGVPARRGRLLVDLSTQRAAQVTYLSDR